MPPFGEVCVCVTLQIIQILLDFSGLLVSQQGVQAVVSCPWTNEDGLTTGEARRDAFLCTCNFPLSVWQEAKPRTSMLRCFVMLPK